MYAVKVVIYTIMHFLWSNNMHGCLIRGCVIHYSKVLNFLPYAWGYLITQF